MLGGLCYAGSELVWAVALIDTREILGSFGVVLLRRIQSPACSISFLRQGLLNFHAVNERRSVLFFSIFVQGKTKGRERKREVEGNPGNSISLENKLRQMRRRRVSRYIESSRRYP